MSETTTEHKVDRTHWPAGPWNEEPDKLNWITAAGLQGMIVRNNLGGLCGYVGVPCEHPAYGKTESSEYELGEDGERDYNRRKPNVLDDVSVHGGITYTKKCAGPICHVPEPGQPDDVWWIGFDCVHAGDWSPSDFAPYLTTRRMPDEHASYRDISYVRGEVETLAEQLVAMSDHTSGKESGGGT